MFRPSIRQKIAAIAAGLIVLAVITSALSIVLACAVAGVVLFGIYPNPIVTLATQAVLVLK